MSNELTPGVCVKLKETATECLSFFFKEIYCTETQYIQSVQG
jgi:hypothetical protein